MVSLPRPLTADTRRTLLFWLLTLPLCGCSTVATTVAPAIGPPSVTAPADGSAALAYVSAPVIAAGSASTMVTLHAAGVTATATLLVDGVAHPATVVSSTRVEATLSASELASPGRHTLQVANPSVPVSNALTVLITPRYEAYGDSITYGGTLADPSTQAYPYLLGASLSLPTYDVAIPGDQVCDIFPTQLTPVGSSSMATPAGLYSVTIGTNDVDRRGVGAYETLFNNCHNAVISWLGTLRTDKVLAGDAAFHASGSCSKAASGAWLGAAPCTGDGGFTVSVVSTGHPVYVWYLLSDVAPSTAQLTVQMDGGAGTTLPTLSAIPIATQNGTHASIGMLRIPAASGSHTVSIVATAGAALLGAGSNRGGNLRPQVVLGDLPNQFVSLPSASVNNQLQYSADIKANLAAALADGIDVRLAQDRSTMLGTGAEMTDSVHPNLLGHQHLAQAFLYALY